VGYKGYEYLIDAATWLGDEYVVLIGGNGPLKEKLQLQIEQ
jgi:rhamnosyl/mannosyltransferase